MSRQLPGTSEIFLDHVAHFVPQLDIAARTLLRLGFTLTPFTAQRYRTPDGMVPTGMANRCVMLREGYLEFLTAVSESELARQFRAATARHVGLHLVAFATDDTEAAEIRLAREGFRPNPLVALTRPVEMPEGRPSEARFTVLRVPPGVMPEGRVQVLRHHTEAEVWQERWLEHPNGVVSLKALLLSVADPEEAAARFGRFLGRRPERRGERMVLPLDRGLCVFVAQEDLARVAPWATPAVPAPWIVATALGSEDVGRTREHFAAGGLGETAIAREQSVYALPPELGGFVTITPSDTRPAWAA